MITTGTAAIPKSVFTHHYEELRNIFDAADSGDANEETKRLEELLASLEAENKDLKARIGELEEVADQLISSEEKPIEVISDGLMEFYLNGNAAAASNEGPMDGRDNCSEDVLAEQVTAVCLKVWEMSAVVDTNPFTESRLEEVSAYVAMQSRYFLAGQDFARYEQDDRELAVLRIRKYLDYRVRKLKQ